MINGSHLTINFGGDKLVEKELSENKTKAMILSHILHASHTRTLEEISQQKNSLIYHQK
jgi:hypothetical protein